jgi:hypothetical protein
MQYTSRWNRRDDVEVLREFLHVISGSSNTSDIQVKLNLDLLQNSVDTCYPNGNLQLKLTVRHFLNCIT